jgi:hypothetical protein
MDKQLIFLLVIAFLFFVGGLFSQNIMMQLSGIVLVIFLLYHFYFNAEENKSYEGKHYGGSGFSFVQFLGNVDLLLGILLLLNALSGFVPHFLLSFLAIILLGKGLVYIWGKDFASLIDIILAVAIIYSDVAMVPKVMLIAGSIYLIQKGMFSLFR